MPIRKCDCHFRGSTPYAGKGGDYEEQHRGRWGSLRVWAPQLALDLILQTAWLLPLPRPEPCVPRLKIIGDSRNCSKALVESGSGCPQEAGSDFLMLMIALRYPLLDLRLGFRILA